jgi:alcohol dehydrogenase (cytochrome c)
MSRFKNFIPVVGAGALAVSMMTPAIVGAQAPPQDPRTQLEYEPVTAERLTNPADGDWLMIRRSYDGWGHSPLDEITTENVGQLRPVWTFGTGETSGHEAPPVVNDGIMFVSTPRNQVIAIDILSGTELWRYRNIRAEGASVPHETNRGVALYDDKVYVVSGEAILVALDARTGEEVWESTFADNSSGYYSTVAPLIADGTVMIGASGGERGIRGFIAGFDPEDGDELWRTFLVPAPGEPGFETWPQDSDAWRTGGASIWVTGNYDPETNLAYWGTGNGGPWMGDQRPGDNLYSTSTVAIDVATGEIKGHHQYHPNGSWDWDEVSPPVLIDYERNGEMIRGLVNVARNGYVWFLERTEDEINYVEAMPYVYQDVFLSLDPVTGRPEVDMNHKPETGKEASYCPALSGGKNWPPIAFNPQTRMIYIPANENFCTTSTGIDVEYRAGRGFTGVRLGGYIREGADHFGEVQAWNVDTGEEVWRHEYAKSPNWGGMLSTAGGLVFSGGTADRMLHAFDAESGEILWEWPTNSGILAPPSSFEVDGKQYIAIQSGWGVDSRGVQARLNNEYPGEFPPIPEGGAVWLFAIDDE